MKTTRVLVSILLAGTIFTACQENAKKKDDSAMNNEVEETTTFSNAENEDITKVKTREYAMKDGTEISYDYSEDGVTSLSDWLDYNTLSYELAEIESMDFKTNNVRVANLDGIISNLGNTIPNWLKTEEVMEDVSDIQKEYKEYLEEKDASEKERMENLEELNEKFADLREELNETINEYMEINKEAIEEYNEEIKKGKYEAAREEYNEEIKKKKKIADYEEKQ